MRCLNKTKKQGQNKKQNKIDIQNKNKMRQKCVKWIKTLDFE